MHWNLLQMGQPGCKDSHDQLLTLLHIENQHHKNKHRDEDNLDASKNVFKFPKILEFTFSLRTDEDLATGRLGADAYLHRKHIDDDDQGQKQSNPNSGINILAGRPVQECGPVIVSKVNSIRYCSKLIGGNDTVCKPVQYRFSRGT
jgi:hypothetical protein